MSTAASTEDPYLRYMLNFLNEDEQRELLAERPIDLLLLMARRLYEHCHNPHKYPSERELWVHTRRLPDEEVAEARPTVYTMEELLEPIRLLEKVPMEVHMVNRTSMATISWHSCPNCPPRSEPPGIHTFSAGLSPRSGKSLYLSISRKGGLDPHTTSRDIFRPGPDMNTSPRNLLSILTRPPEKTSARRTFLGSA
ncbi:hypothetical protein GY45DRAFT_861830 [Cubamyces sp. BRFM 1775]|nr:hypothetical protein GY45DRAFT_861830 [Cubamyces sp. BRFM 1775]